MFEQFKAGVFDGQYDWFIISSGAVVNVLAQAASFYDNVNEQIVFTDEHGSFIRIYSSSKSLEARFYQYASFDILPTNYKSYELNFNALSLPVPNDADIMSKWDVAEKIEFEFLVEMPGMDFSNRLNELQESGKVIGNVHYKGPQICEFMDKFENKNSFISALCPFGPLDSSEEESK